MTLDETKLNAYFDFGENWSKFITKIDEKKIKSAKEDI